jgi:hypothetical protein
MDLERKRQQPIPGYEHPESINVNRDNLYKTFTEGKKKKKFGTTVVGKQYSTLNKAAAEIKEINDCPKCDKICVSTCPCGYSDKTCENGHIWYTDRDGNVVVGNPHKN